MATDPSRIKTIQVNNEEVSILMVDILPDYDKEDYCLNEGDKDLENYFKDCEKVVRTSFEYQELIKYLRNYMDMNKCSYMEGISNMESTKIKIHIHHSPITLFEIVVTIYYKRVFYHENLEIEAVAKEVAYVHYCLLVGLIPLGETIHQMVHNEYFFIPNDAVMGSYNKFVEMYDPWIPPQIKDKLHRLEEYSRLYDEADSIELLQPKYVYLDMSGAYKNAPPTMESIMALLQKRMDAIRENNYSNEPTNLVTFY